MRAKLIKRDDDFYSLKVDGIVMATSNGMLVDYRLSLKNCQAVEFGYDLDELADFLKCKHDWHPPDDLNLIVDVYKQGFQKAVKLMGDKKFTYNQMVSAITESSISHRLPSLIIQDLQQTEWNVDIVMGDPIGIGDKYTPDTKPKLDENGCLILKRK